MSNRHLCPVRNIEAFLMKEAEIGRGCGCCWFKHEGGASWHWARSVDDPLDSVQKVMGPVISGGLGSQGRPGYKVEKEGIETER